jgi:hypothetical protein
MLLFLSRPQIVFSNFEKHIGATYVLYCITEENRNHSPDSETMKNKGRTITINVPVVFYFILMMLHPSKPLCISAIKTSGTLVVLCT